MKPKSRRQCNLLIKTHLIFLVFFGLSLSAVSAQQSIGSYSDTIITEGENTTITANESPQDITSTSAISPNFTGELLVNPNTGNLSITNAKQPGVYSVTVFAYDESGTEVLNTSFQLTVNASSQCSTSFNEQTRFGPEITNENAVIGDFNNDNIQDIANVAFISGAARVQILLGDGNGGFNSTGSQPSFFDPALPEVYLENLHSITSGDFNSDGNLDIAVGAYDKIYIHFGTGTGDISIIKQIIVNGWVTALETGNFNNDGIIDIAVGFHNVLDDTTTIKIYYGDNGISEYSGFNLDDFLVSSMPLVLTDVRIKSLMSGNFNSNSQEELFVVYDPYLTTDGVDENRETSEVLQVNTSNALEPFISLNAFGVQAVTTGNIDGQGTFDVAALTRNGIEIFLNGNVNNQNPNQFIPLEGAYNDIQVINKNGDDSLDLIISSTEADKIMVLLGDGLGGFVEDISVGIENPEALTVGDFNGDGIQDCLVNNEGNSVILGVNNSLSLSSIGDAIETELGNNRLKYIQLDNTGDTDLVIDRETLTLSGPDANLYTIIGHSDDFITLPEANFSAVFPFNINVGQAPKYIVVLFSPETEGTFSATLNVNKGDCDNAITSTDVIGICTSTFTGNIGAYQDVIMTSGENISIASTGGVFEFDRLIATTDVDFDGILSVSPSDGDLTVTNAIKPGEYIIKVNGYKQIETTGFSTEDSNPENWGIISEVSLFPMADTTFVLTINDPICSPGEFEIIDTIEQEDASNLTALAIGDFNMDGEQDLITTFSNFEVTAFANFLEAPGEITDQLFSSFMKLGAGDGTFGLGNTLNRYMTGFDPRGIQIDDYNGDGLHDIVAANSDFIGNVFTRAGLPALQFELPFKSTTNESLDNENGNIRTPYASSYSKDTAFGDFNNDGIKDFAIVSAGAVDPFTGFATPSFVSIQVGDGMAGSGLPSKNHFKEHVLNVSDLGIVVGDRSVSIVVSDFNSDGIQDFATASASENKISIRLGKEGFGPEGDPFSIETGQLFETGSDIAVGEYPSALAKGDFNGDGIIDLAVACRGPQDDIEITFADPDYDQFSTIGSVFIRLGNGNGTFSGSVQVPVGINPSSLKIGDFNGDGNQDFAVTNTNSDDVSIRFGNGDGSFYGDTQIPVGIAPKKLVIGDFDQDNIQDLAVANQDNISILRGKPLSVQEFVVKGNTILIENNDTTPDLEDDTDFGNVIFSGNSITRSFSIENNGESALTLEDGAISIDAVDSDLFSLSTISYPIFIGSGESYNFDVNFEPTFEGEKTAIVTVLNANCVETTDYNFSIKATVIPPPVLGNYLDTELTLGANSVIQPDALPINTLRAVAFTDSSFLGELLVNPVTGEVSVINASQSGVFQVTVTAFTIDDFSASTTFSLTVSHPENCVSEFPFSTNTEFTQTGSKPSSIAIGDFNADGLQDVVVANEESTFISLKFGNGSDGYASETTIPVALNTANVDVADFNGDGHLDIAALNINDNDLYTILGNGDGTFQSAIVSSVALSPSALAIGDFNNDGNSDIAVTSSVNSSVSVLLGNGTGNFIASPEVLVGSLPRHIALVNFNEDAFLDIAVANYNDNTVSIRLGNGDGSFSGTTDIPVGQGPNNLVIGDFNQDGNKDFATANITSNTLSIALGDGLGGTTSITEINTSDSPAMIKVGEFNGDGIQDLVTSSSLLATDNLLKIYSGNGSGGFTETSSKNLCCELSSFAIGNFNNDGFVDVAFATQTNNNIELLFGAGAMISVTGNSSDIADGESITSLANNTDFGRIQTGENVSKIFTIENTGNTNLIIPEDAILAIGNDSDMFSIINTVLPATILPNESFDFEVQFSPVTEGVKETTLHILNNDCKTSDYSFIIEGEGASFSLPNYPTAFTMRSGSNLSIMPEVNDIPVNIVSAIAYVDYAGGDEVPNFEGSFTVDSNGVVHVINAKPEGVYNIKIVGLQNLETTAQVTRTLTLTVDAPLCSDGAFRNIQNELNGSYGSVATEGDFNEDGITDIAAILWDNRDEVINGVHINLGNADGTFQNPQFAAVGSIELTEFSVSDFNGDGHQDLLTRGGGLMYVSLGAGDGSFGTSLNFPINSQFKSHAVGDFNNDGKQDIILRYGLTLTCLIGNGDGTFTEVTSSHSISFPKEIKVGDFNKDGNLDFIALETLGGIQFHRGQGNGLFIHNSVNDIDIDGSSAFYTMGDFNNDAISDIVVGSRDNNSVTPSQVGSFKIYFGNGNGNYNAGPVIPIDYDEIRSLHVGDFNGNSNQDILVNNEYVLFGAGDGTFPVIPIVEASGPLRDYQVVIGDFNKDGKQDYVSLLNDFEVFLGTGRVDVFFATVSEGNVYLNDGETIASEQSNTVFESCLNTTVAKTYTIENTSSSILTINDINITGDTTGLFGLGDLDGFPTTVGPNNSTTFEINFSPISTDVITATLHIENDDCSDQDFSFVIEGQGIASQSSSSVGTYSAVNMVSGDNITVLPDSPPLETATNIRAYTDSRFKGLLNVNPITGQVMVTNAYPAGTYQVTVEALGLCSSASTTFQLVVGNPACSSAVFENVPVFEYESNDVNKEVYVADFNEDGIQDVVISNNKIRIQLGNGDGTFTLHNEIIFEGPSYFGIFQDIAIGDFNGDGHQDITATSNRKLAMYLGDGTGDFMLGDVQVVDNLTGEFAIAEDYNNDGKLDILVKEENETTDETKLAIFLGNGEGGFSLKRDILIDAYTVSVGDFNHDGNKDLVVTSIIDDKVYVLTGNGLAGFTEATAFTINNPHALVLRDFNNDGEQDIVVSTYDWVPNPDPNAFFNIIPANQRVEIFSGTMSGTFSSTPTEVVPLIDDPEELFDHVWEINAGDFNADGNQDLVISYRGVVSPRMPVLLGNGLGDFTMFSDEVLDSHVGNLAVGDFNEDGRQDVIATAFVGSESTNILFGSGPKIALNGNENAILDGSTMPEILNDTDFGTTCPTGTITKTFTIENNGFADLVLDTDVISFSGGDADQFAIGDIELPVTIAANEVATFTVTFTPEGLGVATTTINIATNDCNLSSYSFDILATAVSEESIPPVIECPVIESVYYTNSNSCYATIALNVTATDNCSLEPSVTSNTPLNNQFPVGDTTVVYTATDDNGNTATCEFVITVVDAIAPSIICADPVTLAYGASLDPVDIGSPEVTDNCLVENVALTYLDSSTQGTEGCSVYNYTINRFWTATDATGNTDVCLQVINVVDETGPTVITQDITVVLDESGNATITPEDIDNGSNDACGIATLELDITTFNTSNVGENTVQLTVTDANGNVSVASAIVTIVDESLSIDDNALELGLSVFPNPTQGLINLKLANFNSSKLSYQLFNLQGQLLLSSVINNDLTRIEMYNLSEGIYLLNVNVNNKPIKSFRIIKKQ